MSILDVMVTRASFPWLIALLGAIATIALLYPGQYPFDSAYQLWQARSGQFSNISPVSMTALWSLLLRFGANPAVLLCLNVVLLWIGLALCVSAIAGRVTTRAALLLVLGGMPLMLMQIAHLLSDAHLAPVLVLVTGLLAYAATSGHKAPLWAALLLLIHAGTVRHNALIAILPFGAILGMMLIDDRRALLKTASGGAFGVVLASLVVGAAMDRALVVDRTTVWPTIALWDLAAISVADDVLLLPSFTHGAGMTPAELAETGAFSPVSNTYLFQKSRSGMRDGLTDPYSSDQLALLRGAWWSAVTGHPAAYLKHRLRTFWILIGPHRGDVHNIPYFINRTAFRDNPTLPQPLAPQAQKRFHALAATLRPTWIFAAWPYLLLNIAAVGLGWRRRKQVAGRIALALSTSALLYAASFLVLAPGAELRYLTWPIVAGPLALMFSLTRARNARAPCEPELLTAPS